MQFQIKGKNYELTAETKELVENKLSYLLRFLGETDKETPRAEVEIELVEDRGGEHNIHRFEAKITHEGQSYFAEETRQSLLNAIDDVQEKLSKEIRRLRKKKQSLLRKGGQKIKEWIHG